jgi:5-formyltetrahydrofolate cyclo-ligase
VLSKTAWRLELRRKLTSISDGNPADISARNGRVADHLFEVLEPRAGLWLAYSATMDEPIVDVEVPGVQLAYPRIDVDLRTMDFYVAKSTDASWIDNRYKLREPNLEDSSWQLVARDGLVSGAIRGVLMPALGYDRKFHRLGRGAGFYDRYLTGNRILKVGVVFAEQLVQELPTEPHDIAVDAVITDREVLWKLAAA